MANEYQDQTVWYEVQAWRGHRWAYVSDHDTEEQATRMLHQWMELNPDVQYRVSRISGLDY